LFPFPLGKGLGVRLLDETATYVSAEL